MAMTPGARMPFQVRGGSKRLKSNNKMLCYEGEPDLTQYMVASEMCEYKMWDWFICREDFGGEEWREKMFSIANLLSIFKVFAVDNVFDLSV